MPSIDHYVALLQVKSNLLKNDYEKNIYSVTYGKVWAKVWTTSLIGASQSIHTFIKIADGDIYFAASFKAPSKRIVGNIHDLDPLEGVTLRSGKYAVDKAYNYQGSDSLSDLTPPQKEPSL